MLSYFHSSFHSLEADELSLEKGDDIELTREIDNFWMEGSVNGVKGDFYVVYLLVGWLRLGCV